MATHKLPHQTVSTFVDDCLLSVFRLAPRRGDLGMVCGLRLTLPLELQAIRHWRLSESFVV